MTAATPTAEPLRLARHVPTPSEFALCLPNLQVLAKARGLDRDADVVLYIAETNDAREFFCVGLLGSMAIVGEELADFLRAYDEDCGDPRDASSKGIRSVAAHIRDKSSYDDSSGAIVGRSAVYEGWRSFRVNAAGTLPTLPQLYAANGRDCRGHVLNYYRQPSVN